MTQTQAEQDAERFIAAQTERMLECGVNGMTRRQRRRVKELDVVSPQERAEALWLVATTVRDLGPAPPGDSGQMRVVNWHTGEVRIQRAPRRKIDIELDEAIAEVVL